MYSEFNNLREFCRFRLDTEKKILWYQDEAVALPLKEIELLCVLTESDELVTKDEILNRVWQDSFVEESNLSSHIYRLRKMFAKYGESEDLIKTVPKRGYRFTGQIIQADISSKLLIEKHSISRTMIEEIETSIEPDIKTLLPKSPSNRYWIPLTACLLILATACGYYIYSRSSNKLEGIKSIAILPLKSFDTNASDEQLRLQITDSLITKFGNLKDISVRPTSAVIEFVKSEENSLEIGKRLKVDAVLDGTIQQEGDNLRINFQLISVKNGTQIWSEQFNGKVNQFLHLQDIISAKLLTKVSSPLTANQSKTFEKRPTENIDAYEQYLQGRYFWNLRLANRIENLASARKFFQKAVELDANFALAYASLSDVVAMQSSGEYIPRKEGLELTKILATKAYELDPNLAETNTALGLAMRNENNLAASEKLYRRAIELNPNYTTSYHWLSFIYLTRGEYDKEIEILEAGRKIDPTNYALLYEQVVGYQAANRCDKSLELLPEAIRLEGKAVGMSDVEAVTYSVCGKNAEALSILERILKNGSKNPSSSLLSQLGYSYAKVGNREKALEFAKMVEKKQDSQVYEKATPIYLALGEKEKMFQLLEEMTIKMPHRWSRINYDLRLAPLKDEPRFQALLKKMNQQ